MFQFWLGLSLAQSGGSRILIPMADSVLIRASVVRGSSNGRTTDFDSVNAGSIPAPRSTPKEHSDRNSSLKGAVSLVRACLRWLGKPQFQAAS